MPNTNSWLCNYAIAQLGKPYWYNTAGEISSTSLYADQVKPAIIKELGSYSLYNNYRSQLNVKVHDCPGLIIGALTCDNIDTAPTKKSPISKKTNDMYKSDCDPHFSAMSNFPNIPGTLVFTTKGGVKTHVGIFVGDFIDLNGKQHSGEVIDALGHNWGIVTSKLKDPKWDSWGQLKCCTIDTTKGMNFDARTTIGNLAYGNPQASIQAEKMKPFVATVSTTYKGNINYNKIKEARISAMMFFGGELYDITHTKKTYVNPNLSGLVQQCNNAGMPYALYVNVRSQSEIEADEECKALYYIISRYPPKLGIWLSLQNSTSVIVCNKILERYYRYFEKWGIAARCGLYVTPQQLTKITWDNFKDRFYLWMIDNMDVTKVDDELLQPEMFEVPD